MKSTDIVVVSPTHRLAPAVPLVVRLVVGAVMIGHGFHFTPQQFGALITQFGLPGGQVIGWAVTLLLFGGGGLLILGFLSRLVTIPAILHLLLATLLVELGDGLAPKDGGGAQIPLLLIAGLLLVLVCGPGPYSVDNALGLDNGWTGSRRRADRVEPEPAA